MHEKTFAFLDPTPAQVDAMARCRQAARLYGEVIEAVVPPGVDRDYIMRLLRTTATWVNTAITRMPDGSPRA
jgi:hypothetical protein